MLMDGVLKFGRHTNSHASALNPTLTRPMNEISRPSNYSQCYIAIAGSAIASRGVVARSIDIGVGSNLIWQVYTDMIASDLNIIKY